MSFGRASPFIVRHPLHYLPIMRKKLNLTLGVKLVLPIIFISISVLHNCFAHTCGMQQQNVVASKQMDATVEGKPR
jgi:hypothetical protein